MNTLESNHTKNIELLESLCEQVSKVHEAGKVILDISPDMVSFDENGDCSLQLPEKLADYGVPIAVSRDMLTWKKWAYSPEYRISSLKGKPFTPTYASDIYSLMVTYYYLLTGRAPENNTWREKANVFGKSCHEWDDKKKAALQSLFHKCTRTKRYRRIQNCRQLLDSEEYRILIGREKIT